MIETSLMVNDYPEPPEVEEQTVIRTVTVTYEVELDVPKSWNNDAIYEYITNNLEDYITIHDWKDIEI